MYPTMEKILNLVKECDIYKIVLPEFQRSFIWPNQDIKDLLISILNGYFVGTLLFLRRDNTFGFGFKIRYIEGVDKVNTNLPPHPIINQTDLALLDGQQRLTALYYVLYNPPLIAPKFASYPYRYFIDINKKLNGDDWDIAIFSISENDSTKNIDIDLGGGKKTYSFKEIIKHAGNGSFTNLLNNNDFKQYCYEKDWIPSASLKEQNELNKWLDGYINYFLQKGMPYTDVSKKKNNIIDLFNNWFSFEIPCLILENKPIYEVAEIFERINRTGIELSVFALATAVFFSSTVNLRDWWQSYYNNRGNIIENFCNIEDETYPKYILQIMALLQGKDVKKKTLIDSKILKVGKPEWDQACDLLDKALKRLSSYYGVIKKDLLPYKPIIVPLASILHNCQNYNKIDRWYWASVFTGRYAVSSDTVVKQDFDQLKTWLSNNNQVPYIVSNAPNRINQIDLVSVDRGALYNAILNIIASKGAKDFFSSQYIKLGDLNDHHIFPKKCGIQIPNENSILNRTLICEDTNKNKIKNKKPSQYLNDMVQTVGSVAAVKDILKTHLIDDNCYNAMMNDDPIGFFNAREKLILQEMLSRI